ncbi:hypothetical protein MBM_08714 [Drepanopeziza brunnea f. sp. 'multigermtubi' MB_m1]|uniref:Uncharacterized protein n=1 Tax=Marssonina brunnea f. sp. multigermtubi (strain MB_m1) TaxID=1072389 RepID=K1WK79_MARBU|nr:uncharacterized protein MBM_08714 [Drepanopeziza brunnea f. sp. 'multigermtubi' MB_m1]EKD13271.1 hypothetical protein MBM_08714 [Drepanopeziza brunnea f. sp. 'multigermtubi' MB_m1]
MDPCRPRPSVIVAAGRLIWWIIIIVRHQAGALRLISTVNSAAFARPAWHDPSLRLAYSLQPTAFSLQPTAYSLQPTAYRLRAPGSRKQSGTIAGAGATNPKVASKASDGGFLQLPAKSRKLGSLPVLRSS